MVQETTTHIVYVFASPRSIAFLSSPPSLSLSLSLLSPQLREFLDTKYNKMRSSRIQVLHKRINKHTHMKSEEVKDLQQTPAVHGQGRKEDKRSREIDVRTRNAKKQILLLNLANERQGPTWNQLQRFQDSTYAHKTNNIFTSIFYDLANEWFHRKCRSKFYLM